MIEEIRQAIHNARQGNKIATFHFQVLIHARELQNYDAVEFCRAVDVPDSYATEFRKMLKLAMIMIDSGTDLERTELFKARTQESVIPRSFNLASPALEGFPTLFEESTNHKLELLNSAIDSLRKSTFSSIEKLNSMAENFESYRQSSQDYLWLLNSGVDISQVEVTRYIPVRVYVSDPVPDEKTLSAIVGSVESMLDSVGFEKTDEFPDESGSWWKRLALKTKVFFTQDEVTDSLEKVKRAAELAVLDKPQAEANLCQAQGASALISSLEGTESACIQAGSLLVVKASDNGRSSIVVRTLTPIELKHLEENQAVLRRPNEIIDWLESSGAERLTSQASGTPQSGAPS